MKLIQSLSPKGVEYPLNNKTLLKCWIIFWKKLLQDGKLQNCSLRPYPKAISILCFVQCMVASVV
jgi:hypothetical protein